MEIAAVIMAAGLYDGFECYMRGKRIYVSRSLARNIGKDTWNGLLKEFIGYFTFDRKKGIAIDCLYDEMKCLFPCIFSEDTINQEDQLLETFENLRNARKYKKEIRANANNINYQFKRWSM
jgi:hypothetical protein